MKYISILIKPISGSCNIDCKYCFYRDLQNSGDVLNTGKMSKETMENVIDNTLINCDPGDGIEYAFQGGEPTLAGIDFFRDFIDYVKEVNVHGIRVSYSIQTNGILIDDCWCKFFKENNFLVGLSLDGPKDINDKYRLDGSGGTFNQIVRAKKLFEYYQIPYNILSVLTNEIARRPDEIWSFIKDENIKYIQFIPCMDELFSNRVSEYQLMPDNFLYFYKRIFDHWLNSLSNGEFHSVGFIEQLITYLTGESIGTCILRGRCSFQYVVESDGNVYPCDFYVLKNYCGGNLNQKTIEEIFYSKNMQSFLREDQKLGELCYNCNYINICHGGCKRMKNIMYLNKDGDFCGYRGILDYVIPHISKMI